MMTGDVARSPGHHKRSLEEKPRKYRSDKPLYLRNYPTTSATEFRNIHLVGEDADSSIASSHKRARLCGEYRENSSVMDSSDEDGETTLCSNVAVRSASEDASTGRWLLRSSPSNFSITSTLTEISDTMDTVSNPGHDSDLPEDPSPPCFVLEANPGAEVGDQVENMTSRLDSWSLTRMKTMKMSNICSADATLLDMNVEAMSESRKCRRQQTKNSKREVMRAFRRSNSSITD